MTDITTKKLSHEMVWSEIKYGMIALRKTDGTLDFFSNLPDSFTINLRGENLFYRTHNTKKVWLGVQMTRKFRPGEKITIYLKGDTVYID